MIDFDNIFDSLSLNQVEINKKHQWVGTKTKYFIMAKYNNTILFKFSESKFTIIHGYDFGIPQQCLGLLIVCEEQGDDLIFNTIGNVKGPVALILNKCNIGNFNHIGDLLDQAVDNLIKGSESLSPLFKQWVNDKLSCLPDVYKLMHDVEYTMCDCTECNEYSLKSDDVSKNTSLLKMFGISFSSNQCDVLSVCVNLFDFTIDTSIVYPFSLTEHETPTNYNNYNDIFNKNFNEILDKLIMYCNGEIDLKTKRFENSNVYKIKHLSLSDIEQITGDATLLLKNSEFVLKESRHDSNRVILTLCDDMGFEIDMCVEKVQATLYEATTHLFDIISTEIIGTMDGYRIQSLKNYNNEESEIKFSHLDEIVLIASMGRLLHKRFQ